MMDTTRRWGGGGGGIVVVGVVGDGVGGECRGSSDCGGTRVLPLPCHEDTQNKL